MWFCQDVLRIPWCTVYKYFSYLSIFIHIWPDLSLFLHIFLHLYHIYPYSFIFLHTFQDIMYISISIYDDILMYTHVYVHIFLHSYQYWSIFTNLWEHVYIHGTTSKVYIYGWSIHKYIDIYISILSMVDISINTFMVFYYLSMVDISMGKMCR